MVLFIENRFPTFTEKVFKVFDYLKHETHNPNCI